MGLFCRYTRGYFWLDDRLQNRRSYSGTRLASVGCILVSKGAHSTGPRLENIKKIIISNITCINTLENPGSEAGCRVLCEAESVGKVAGKLKKGVFQAGVNELETRDSTGEESAF